VGPPLGLAAGFQAQPGEGGAEQGERARLGYAGRRDDDAWQGICPGCRPKRERRLQHHHPPVRQWGRGVGISYTLSCRRRRMPKNPKPARAEPSSANEAGSGTVVCEIVSVIPVTMALTPVVIVSLTAICGTGVNV